LRRGVPVGLRVPERAGAGGGGVGREVGAGVGPLLLGALLSRSDLTYREIAGELGMSQGSLGPVRSRCLGCLRRMLTAEIAAPELWGKER
ncbi:sigma-70 family RNA polymerase sigma factor, partial [Streptomyces sp. NPDC005970]